MYTKKINWYLENTSLFVFVVDSYNQGFDIKHDRLFVSI